MNIIEYKGYTDLEILNFIENTLNNDKEAFDNLLNIFKEKLMIRGNDNYTNELISFFCELIIKIDYTELFNKQKLINYILSSIKKKKSNIFKDNQQFTIELDENHLLSYDNSLDDIIILNILISKLTVKDKTLLILYYKYGYTEEMIASYFKVTKQAISKRKKLIINNLKKNF